MPVTSKTINGVEYAVNEKQKCEAVNSNGTARIRFTSIYGRVSENPVRGVDADWFVKTIAEAFYEHNKAVDESLVKIRKDAMEEILQYCGKKETANERKAFILSALIKGYYDMKIGKIMYRVNEDWLTIFYIEEDGHKIIEFPISKEEFEAVQNLFIKF